MYVLEEEALSWASLMGSTYICCINYTCRHWHVFGKAFHIAQLGLTCKKLD